MYGRFANAPQEKLLGQPLFYPTCLTRLTCPINL